MLDQVAGRAPGADDSAHQGHNHNDTKLHPREEEKDWDLSKHNLLQHHSKRHSAANHHAEQAACNNQDECLIEVEHLDPSLGEAHRPKDSNLLRLIQQVSTHTRSQGEQTQKHRDDDNRTEDEVKDQHDCVHCVIFVKLILEPNVIGLIR